VVGRPHVVQDEQGRPVAQQVAQHAASVLEIAEDLRLAGQRLGKLVLAAEQVRRLADRKPEDAVRERGADGGVVRERGGEHGLADAAHPVKASTLRRGCGVPECRGGGDTGDADWLRRASQEFCLERREVSVAGKEIGWVIGDVVEFSHLGFSSRKGFLDLLLNEMPLAGPVDRPNASQQFRARINLLPDLLPPQTSTVNRPLSWC